LAASWGNWTASCAETDARRLLSKRLDSRTVYNPPGAGENEDKKREEEYWVRATLVEALLGLGNTARSETEFAVAKRVGPEQWMIDTTEEQLTKLRALQR
jgi:hypothetical protein